jgi:hypothetical protein
MRNKIIAGLTTAVVAAAIGAPAANAQAVLPVPADPAIPAQPSTPTGTPTPELISPAQPGVPTNLQPAGPTAHIDPCTVKRSRNGKGYTYAACPVVADNVPFDSTVAISFQSNLKTFKPHTNATWSNQKGVLTLSSKGTPGMVAGQTTTIIGGVKFAFAGKSLAQVNKSLKVFIASASPNLAITAPIGFPHGLIGS